MGRMGIMLAMLWAGPTLGHESVRIDKCGCHNQYGLRHCHPSKKGPRCAAPVKSRPIRDGPRPGPVRV